MDRVADDILHHFIYPYKPYKVEVVGSVARGVEQPKDIDYLITIPSMATNNLYATYLADMSMAEPYEITKVDKCGTYNCYFHVLNKQNNRTHLINLFLTDKKHYFFGKLARLADKGHNIYYKKLARDKGLLLNNTGLYSLQTDEPITQKFNSVDSIKNFLEL